MVSAFLVPRTAGGRHGWNIDGRVGAKSPNLIDDVQLVQFGNYCMLKNTKGSSADERETFSRIPIGRMCTGRDDDPLVRAIKAHQASRGGTQDGFISVLQPTRVTYESGGKKLGVMLNALLNAMFDEIGGDKWPRIHDHDKCPAELKKKLATLSNFKS